MSEISCLLCGEKLTLPSYIDQKDYDGEFRCDNCFGRLHVKLVDSKVLKYRVVSEPKTFTFADYIKVANRETEQKGMGKEGNSA